MTGFEPRSIQLPGGTGSKPNRALIGWAGRVVQRYKQDHTHPVNVALHLGLGWPLVAASILILPFQWRWSLALLVIGYAAMFAGHFIFERNLPTILRNPWVPVAMAIALIRGFFSEGLGTLRQYGVREGQRRRIKTPPR